MAGAERRSLREEFAGVFDDVAAQYDAVRPSYPAALIEAALEAGALDSRSAVLEIGSGTGKLTELLVARGLRVHAIEPGANLVAAARRRVAPADAVQFDIARFEDADLPAGTFDAVFSATAFHWVDPKVGWSKVGALLKPGGLLALLVYIDIHDERSAALDREFVELLRAYVPGDERAWPHPRRHETVIAGADERAGNASAVWDWIMGAGRHAMAVPEGETLFDDARLATVVEYGEQSADELLALLRTTSLYFMIDASRREAFEQDTRRLIARHGGTFLFTRAAVLMTARTSAGDASG